jgi:hypothetical protein
MKALSTPLLIVVTAIVLLVVAIVVIMVFIQGVGDANAYVAYKSNCITQCTMSCKIGSMPPTWGLKAYVPSLGKDTSCATETQIDNDCSKCGGTSATTPTGGCSGKIQKNCPTPSCQWCSGPPLTTQAGCMPAGQCNIQTIN